MGLFSDIGGVPAVTVKDGDGDKSTSYGWIFALVIIFLALVFLWGRKDEKRHDGYASDLAPLAAASMLSNNQHKPCDYDYGREHWDMNQAYMKDFGLLNKQIAETGWNLSREFDKNNFDLSRQIDGVKYDTSRHIDSVYNGLERGIDGVKHQNAIDARDIMRLVEDRIKGLETKIDRNEIDRLRDELTQARCENSHHRFQAPYPRYFCEQPC